MYDCSSFSLAEAAFFSSASRSSCLRFSSSNRSCSSGSKVATSRFLSYLKKKDINDPRTYWTMQTSPQHRVDS